LELETSILLVNFFRLARVFLVELKENGAASVNTCGSFQDQKLLKGSSLFLDGKFLLRNAKNFLAVLIFTAGEWQGCC
jgi:hypothetical protein